MVQLLEELSILVDNPGRGQNEQPPIGEYYKEVTPLGHLFQSGNCSLSFNYTHESLFCEARVSFDEGRQIKVAENHEEFKKDFHEKIITSKCFAMDGSKMENKPFVGFASIDISDGIREKSRITKIASTFTAEALATGETLEIIDRTDSKQNFVTFSDSQSVLKGIGDTSTMNKT
jgi:hypothetical protein